MSQTDECCRKHDICYTLIGLSAEGFKFHCNDKSPGQMMCDRAFCRCLHAAINGAAEGGADVTELAGNSNIQSVFCDCELTSYWRVSAFGSALVLTPVSVYDLVSQKCSRAVKLAWTITGFFGLH